MNDLMSVASSVCDVGDAMQAYAYDTTYQDKYRAAVDIYIKSLELNMELAHEFLRQNKEINNRVFQSAMTYLDYAIESANTKLAESALKLIETIKKSEPEFYKKYYDIMFGR